MAIVEKKCEPVSGWTLSEIIDRVDSWGADYENVALEPVSLGPGLMTVPALVWYEGEN